MPKIELDLDSKFLRKLLETAASGVGAVAGAWLMKRDAHANADAMRIEAQGRRDAEDILSGKKVLSENGALINTDGALPKLTDEIAEEGEIQARLSFQERKRQENIRAIFDKASQHGGGDVSDEAVDHDWIAKFFTYAQDVSNDEMQNIWAKILSDEVKKPGSCSLRTMEVLKVVTKADAIVFEKIRPFLIGSFLPNDGNLLENYGITLDDIIKLEDAGLINAGFGRSKILINRKINEKYLGAIVINPEAALVVQHDKPDNVLKLGSYDLTIAGMEINSVLPPATNNIPFLKEVCEPHKANGYYFHIAPVNGKAIKTLSIIVSI